MKRTDCKVNSNWNEKNLSKQAKNWSKRQGTLHWYESNKEIVIKSIYITGKCY